jgi:predicted RNA-binding protein YlqC (UPF0109 family)
MQEQDQEFVEYVVKALVDHPEEVRTDRTVDEMGVLITLHLDPEDMGQVIGRQGQTAKAIRTLLRVVGAKHKSRVNLKIDEPEGSTHRMRPPQSEEHSSSHESTAPQPAADPLDSFDSIDDFKL